MTVRTVPRVIHTDRSNHDVTHSVGIDLLHSSTRVLFSWYCLHFFEVLYGFAR